MMNHLTSTEEDMQEKRKEKLLLLGTVMFNSFMAFLVSAFFIQLLDNALKYLLANRYGYEIEIRHFQIHFLISNSVWSFSSVMAVYALIPMFIGGLGVIAGYLLRWGQYEPGRIKLLLFWFSLQSLSFLLSNFLLGTFVHEGMGYALAWFYPGWFERIVMIFFGIVAMLTMVLFFSTHVIYLANTYFDQLTENEYPLYISAQALVPFILGTIVITVFNIFHMTLNQWASIAFLVLVLVLMVMRADPPGTIYFGIKKRNHTQWWYLTVPLLVFASLLWYFFW